MADLRVTLLALALDKRGTLNQEDSFPVFAQFSHFCLFLSYKEPKNFLVSIDKSTAQGLRRSTGSTWTFSPRTLSRLDNFPPHLGHFSSSC